jgi:hypothetical protein
MIGYRIDVMASRARYGTPVVILASLSHAISSRGWVGSWSDTVRAATNSFTLLVPLLVACACLDVGRGVCDEDVLSIGRAGRPTWHVIVVRMSATMTWALVAFGVVATTTGVITFGRTSFQAYPWSLLGVSILGIMANISVGFLLGRFLPRLAAIPLAIFLTYGFNIYLSLFTDQSAALFTTIDSGIFAVSYELRPQVAWGQAAWFITVIMMSAAVLVATCRPWRNSSRTVNLVVAAAAGLAVVAGINLAGLGGGRTQVANRAGPRSCTADGSVCLWRDHGYLLPMSEKVSARMLDPSTGWQGGPVALVELGLTDHRPAAVPVFLSSNQPTEYDVARSITSAIMNDRICATTQPTPSVDLLAREEWLTLRGLSEVAPAEILDDEVRRVRLLPAAKQWAWFRDLAC